MNSIFYLVSRIRKTIFIEKIIRAYDEVSRLVSRIFYFSSQMNLLHVNTAENSLSTSKNSAANTLWNINIFPLYHSISNPFDLFLRLSALFSEFPFFPLRPGVWHARVLYVHGEDLINPLSIRLSRWGSSLNVDNTGAMVRFCFRSRGLYRKIAALAIERVITAAAIRESIFQLRLLSGCQSNGHTQRVQRV